MLDVLFFSSPDAGGSGTPAFLSRPLFLPHLPLFSPSPLSGFSLLPASPTPAGIRDPGGSFPRAPALRSLDQTIVLSTETPPKPRRTKPCSP